MLKYNPTTRVKDLLLNNSTNILTIIYSNLYFPTYSNSLKDIGKYLGYTWSNAELTGIQTIVWRKKWEKTNDVDLKEVLVKYNYEDCVALKILTNFVYDIFNDDHNKQSDNISLAEECEDYNEELSYGVMDYVSNDIKIITKCAYFEYQRNKIFFRTNKNIRKINKRKAKQIKSNYKPNKLVNFIAHKCPRCNHNDVIRDANKINSKICFDLHFSPFGVKRWIIEYQAQDHFCLCCKRSFQPIKFTELHLFSKRNIIRKDFTKQRGYRHSLMAWTIYQHVVNRVSLENIEKTTKDFFKLPLNFNTLWRFKIGAAKYYSSIYDKILKKIINGHLVHADETGVRLRKVKGYVWVLTNMEEVYYFYRPTRESGFLHDLLKNFNGVLVTDFYSGYDSLPCPQQKCLIHLIRDLNNALLKNPIDDELKQLVTKFASLLKSIMNTIDKFGLKNKFMGKHKNEVNNFYKWLQKQIFNSELAEKFKKRMMKYEKELFLFLDYDNVPWNNNNAEHAVKYFAKYRRLVNGRIAERGLNAHLILLSIYQTCDYKGINFLDFLLSKERDIDKFNMKH